MHQVITQSPEWRAWRESNAYTLAPFKEDISDAEETGFFTPKHWKSFLRFLEQTKEKNRESRQIKIRNYSKNETT
jgi:hypothetical protein